MAASAVAPVVVFTVGNPSRGDDAIGPVLHGRLSEWVENENLGDEIELIEDFQLNIEHALDLTGRRLAVFVDAGENTPAPFDFCRISPSTVPAHSTHALSPAAVLDVYRRSQGDEPPPAFQLCVRGASFELGAPLSAAAQSHVEAAWRTLRDVLAAIDPLCAAQHVIDESHTLGQNENCSH